MLVIHTTCDCKAKSRVSFTELHNNLLFWRYCPFDPLKIKSTVLNSWESANQHWQLNFTWLYRIRKYIANLIFTGKPVNIAYFNGTSCSLGHFGTLRSLSIDSIRHKRYLVALKNIHELSHELLTDLRLTIFGN